MSEIPLPKDIHQYAKQGVAQVKKKRTKKWVALPAAAVLLSSSLTVGAAYNESLNQLVSLISPEFAALLQPIDVLTVDEGIQVEVISAMQDKHSAVIYLAITDLNEERITANLDVYDFSLSKGSSFNAQTIDYDESTRTAIVRIFASNGLEAKKLNLRVRSLIGDKTVIEPDVSIQLVQVTKQTLQPLTEDALSGTGGLVPASPTLHTLPFGNLDIRIPNYDGMKIKNMGISEEKLYIQTEWLTKHHTNYDYARFYLIDSEGDKKESDFRITYGRNEQGLLQYGNNFNEYVFNLSNSDLSSYRLAPTIYHSVNPIEGNWQVSFNLDSMESKTFSLNENIYDWELTTLELSPLGITLQGKGELKEQQPIQAKLYMTDGSTKIVSHYTSMMEDSTFKMTLYPDQMIDFSEIQSIELDGVIINL